MAEVEATAQRREGQDGSRWYNAPPSGGELAKWFNENVPLHDGLEPKHYLPGVTMIPATEKAQTVTGWQGAAPVIQRIENLVFVPYAKVETRVKYFWDLMAQNEEWLGVIEPVATEKQAPGLPKGFFPFRVQNAEGIVNYVCCTMKVTVFDRESVSWKEYRNSQTGAIERVRTGKIVIDAAPATKMIPTVGRWGVDDHSVMKAETGAIGRALGMAGMLVIPGTGIATAEDMQEVGATEGRPTPTLPEEGERAQVPQEQPPPEGQTIDDMRQQATLLLNTIKAEFPGLFETFIAWATDRKIGEIGKVEDPRILRGVITKAERELTEARREKAAEEPTVEQPADPGVATT